MKLNISAVGIAMSILLGVGLLVGTWWAMIWQGFDYEMDWLGQYFRGYSVSPMGSLAGLLWGLGIGFISGVILAWLYNVIVKSHEST